MSFFFSFPFSNVVAWCKIGCFVFFSFLLKLGFWSKTMSFSCFFSSFPKPGSWSKIMYFFVSFFFFLFKTRLSSYKQCFFVDQRWHGPGHHCFKKSNKKKPKCLVLQCHLLYLSSPHTPFSLPPPSLASLSLFPSSPLVPSSLSLVCAPLTGAVCHCGGFSGSSLASAWLWPGLSLDVSL